MAAILCLPDCVAKWFAETYQSLANKLKEAAIDEIKFQWGINAEIDKLNAKVKELKKLTFNPKPSTSLAEAEKARHAAFDIEDVVEEYEMEMELLESNKPSNFCELNSIRAFTRYFVETAKLRLQFHQKVKNLEPELVQQAENQTAPEEEEEEHDSPPVGRENVHIIGMETEFSELLNLVEQPSNPMQVITVWGSGGSGKTTLVNKVYERVKMNKEIDCWAWVSVNQSSRIEVLRSTVKEISKNFDESVPKDEELHRLSEKELRHRIRGDLERKRYVLVLDDVWDPESIEYIALPTNTMSSVIITSRQGDIAVKFIIQLGYGVGSRDIKLNPLNRELSWDLFCKSAFLNNTPPGSCPNNSIERIAKELVARCDGLPLAILTIGNLMSTKGNDLRKWEKVCQHLYLELQGNLAQLNRVLLLSYHHLPIHLKPCFLYCAMFPKSVQISIRKLIRLWIAEGFVKHDDRQTPEAVARGYFDELINRSMLQFRAESKGFQMHDLLREVAVHMIAEENFGKLIYHNTVVEDDRRLAVHAPNVQLDSGTLKLRSFLEAGDGKFYSSLSQFLQNIKLIRTLNLEGVGDIINVPDEVGDLIHLRYLSLRRTGLHDLPDSVKKLRRLETLDIRGNGSIENVPTGIAELKQLRHLLLKKENTSEYVKMQDISFEFTQLQSLDGVHLDHDQARELRRITRLTKLNISSFEESWMDIFTAIGMMNNLRTLKLKALVNGKFIQLENLSSSPFLEKLELKGFTGLRYFIASHENLREIDLQGGDLNEDSFTALGQLPGLENLSIIQSYQGNRLICEPESFPALKVFFIGNTRDLTTWGKIPKGSMKCLRELSIWGCNRLQMLPRGLEELKNLQKLDLIFMPRKFIDRTRAGGPDYKKIRHIPRITRNWDLSPRWLRKT